MLTKAQSFPLDAVAESDQGAKQPADGRVGSSIGGEYSPLNFTTPDMDPAIVYAAEQQMRRPAPAEHSAKRQKVGEGNHAA